jgi:hypothetical protein
MPPRSEGHVPVSDESVDYGLSNHPIARQKDPTPGPRPTPKGPLSVLNLHECPAIELADMTQWEDAVVRGAIVLARMFDPPA